MRDMRYMRYMRDMRDLLTLAYHSNLIVGEPVRMVDPVDIDPGPHLLRVILSVGALLHLTGQIKRELARLRVDVDVVIVLQVEEKVAVDLELYL